MEKQKKQPRSQRPVDFLTLDISSWWKKSFIYVSRKKIETWHGLFIVLFVGGVFAGIILTVANNIQQKTRAATGSAVLSWQPNTEADLAGYKLYYGTTARSGANPPGGYASQVNVGKVTSYTLAGLSEGQTYYFSLTAYDTSNNESGFSNEVNKAIPITPVTCTSFTYSQWSNCVNGTQTRTVVSSSPTGCTGGNPVLSQSCTNTCTSFTYSPWSTCTNGTQTRTIVSSSPTGCTGGNPVLSQSCTNTCTSFTYSAWSTCTNGTQTRTIVSSSPAGCTGGDPILTQSCNPSGTICTTFRYSKWSACVNGTRTRTVISSSPSGCTGGTPVLSQSCGGKKK